MNFQEIFSGWGGGIIGGFIGLLGAAFGTYCSIKNTQGPRERAFMVNVAVWNCVGVVLFLGLLFGLGLVLPHPYKPFAFVVFVLLIPALCIAIPMYNRRQAQIRAEEAQPASRDEGGCD